MASEIIDGEFFVDAGLSGCFGKKRCKGFEILDGEYFVEKGIKRTILDGGFVVKGCGLKKCLDILYADFISWVSPNYFRSSYYNSPFYTKLKYVNKDFSAFFKNAHSVNYFANNQRIVFVSAKGKQILREAGKQTEIQTPSQLKDLIYNNYGFCYFDCSYSYSFNSKSSIIDKKGNLLIIESGYSYYIEFNCVSYTNLLSCTINDFMSRRTTVL